MNSLCEVTLYFGKRRQDELPATKDNIDRYLKDELVISLFKDNRYFYLGLVQEINKACADGTASFKVKAFMRKFVQHILDNRRTWDNMFPKDKIPSYSDVADNFMIPSELEYEYILLDAKCSPVGDTGLYKTLDDAIKALNVSYEKSVVESRRIVDRLLAGESLDSIFRS